MPVPLPRAIVRLSCSLAICLALAACGGRPAAPPAATAMPLATQAPAPPATQAPAPTEPPAATEAPAEPAVPATEVPVPTDVPAPAEAPAAQAEQVLALAPGSGPGQVGVGEAGGPSAFRIGADGSVRVLDPVNRRVLFFAVDGKQLRATAIPEAVQPADFIVNTAGEVFVYDTGVGPDGSVAAGGPRVLRYSPAGKLAATYPVSRDVAANAIMLTADQDLLLISGSTDANSTATTILHRGAAVAPDQQPLTTRRGMATPRSSVLFSTQPADGAVELDIGPLTGDASAAARVALPQGSRFLNVDRALNLYMMYDSPDTQRVSVWRVAPDGGVLGGGSFSYAGCEGFSWRSVYVDQTGSLWSMCGGAEGAKVLRYQMVADGGAPLDLAAVEPPAGLPWAPGSPGVAA